jgi:hypothetical protein
VIAWGWALVGAGVVAVAGLVFFACAEREFRQALRQVLGALVLGPAMLIGLLVRSHGPRLMRLSPGGLERFSRQTTGTGQSAWALTYRGHGVIMVRRARGTDWVGDVPNRMNRARDAR